MGRLIIRSFFDDIKNFKKMMLYRRQKIEEAVDKPLLESYGVNELSEALHPYIQKAVITSVATTDNSMKIITLSPFGNADFAQFKAGQGINIKIGSETTFFPILSSPDDKNYSIVVHTDLSDEVSEYLLGADLDTELEVSGPTGLFYYSPLRDGNSIVLVCDIYGVAPVLSICKYLSARVAFVNVLLLDGEEKSYGAELFSDIKNINLLVLNSTDEINNKLSEIAAPSAFFVGGQHSFCEAVKQCAEKSPMLKGRVRLFIADPSAVFQDTSDKRHSCQVIYRDKFFSFDCFENETLLSAFERNSIPTQAKCKVGECGYCRCKLLEGEVETVLCNDIDSRRSADEKYSFIHPCRTFTKTDIKVKL